MIVMPTIPLRNKNAGMVYQHVHFRDGECDKITASAGEDAWQAGGVGGYGTGPVQSYPRRVAAWSRSSPSTPGAAIR